MTQLLTRVAVLADGRVLSLVVAVALAVVGLVVGGEAASAGMVTHNRP